MVPGMTSEEQVEPGDMTDRFQAFSETVDPAPSRALPIALVVAAGVAIIALVATVVIIFK
jgi:hypothetical protein